MQRTLFLLLAAALVLPAADLTGNWPGTLRTDAGVDNHNLTLKQSGSAIAGTIAIGKNKWDIQEAKLEGQKLTFVVALSPTMVLAYDLQVKGGEISGTIAAKQGRFPGGDVKFTRAN